MGAHSHKLTNINIVDLHSKSFEALAQASNINIVDLHSIFFDRGNIFYKT